MRYYLDTTIYFKKDKRINVIYDGGSSNRYLDFIDYRNNGDWKLNKQNRTYIIAGNR